MPMNEPDTPTKPADALWTVMGINGQTTHITNQRTLWEMVMVKREWPSAAVPSLWAWEGM